MDAMAICLALTSEFKLKVRVGGVNVIMARDPGKQDYFVNPDQNWIDGITVGSGLVRQFITLPADTG